MVEAGIARKVDFGEGRFRFEHSYRHPRHFHLICKTCNQLVRVPELRHRSADRGSGGRAQLPPRQSVLQIYGTCENCRTGRRAARQGGTTEPCSPAMRCASPSPPSAAASSSTRARPRMTPTRAAGSVFEKLAGEEKEHLGEARGALPRAAAQDPELEAQPTFLFFKGAANGLFAAGAEELKKGVDDVRRCSSASGASAARTSSSSVTASVRGVRGQAHVPRVRRRGARTSRTADSRIRAVWCARAAGGAKNAARRAVGVIDLHLHTTASDGRSTPAALVARAAAAGHHHNRR